MGVGTKVGNVGDYMVQLWPPGPAPNQIKIQQITKVEGVLSGTLNWVLNELTNTDKIFARYFSLFAKSLSHQRHLGRDQAYLKGVNKSLQM